MKRISGLSWIIVFAVAIYYMVLLAGSYHDAFRSYIDARDKQVKQVMTGK